MPPNKSPTALGAPSSAVAVHVAGRRWLSYVGRHLRITKNCTPLIVAALLASLFAGCSQKPAVVSWSSSSTIVISPSISIGSLHSGMTIQDVIAEIGQPTRTNAAGLEFSGSGIFICPLIGEFTLCPPFAGHTKEGIGMGASRADVVSAYGQPSVAKVTNPGFELLRYEPIGMKFQIHDGRVDWIDAIAKP
jgi:hypothetical protein